MKRILALVAMLLMLSGCTNEDNALHTGMELREKLLQRQCSFTAIVTADYGDKTYSFSLGCSTNPDGGLDFIVCSPETIAGIAGKISAGSGLLTFDDTALAFPLLAEGEVSPVSAPWLLIGALRGGYISDAGSDGEYTRLTVFDSYDEDSLQLDIWLNQNDLPERADILWHGRRVLSIDVKEFSIL